MFLKMMGSESLPDSDSRKTSNVLADVVGVLFVRDDDGAYAEVTFADGMNERFRLFGNAYLLNQTGKTISSFGIADPAV